ncbi:MAG: hypothetical protein WCY53_00985 [Sphaerochaetaceae bacterium]
MKRKVTILILLCFLLFSLSAHHNPSSFSLQIFNDNLTLGLADNKDDLRSFGFDMQYTHQQKWFLLFEGSGITRRPYGTGEGMRYDEIAFRGGYNLNYPFRQDIITLRLNAVGELGLLLAGKLGFEAIQNIIHDTFSISEVELNYESDKAHLFAQMAAETSLDLMGKFPWFQDSHFIIRPEVRALYSPAYEARILSGISIGQRTLYKSEFMFGLGYEANWALDEWESHISTLNSEAGLSVYVKGHLGLFAFSYRWNFESLQGYGSLGVDIGFRQRVKYTRNDISLSLGLLVPNNMMTTFLRYRVGSNGGIFIGNSYKMTPLPSGNWARQTYGVWQVGYDYEFPIPKMKIFKPYVHLGIGAERFLVMENGDESREKVLDYSRFVVNPAVGLRFLPYGQISYEGVSYALELSGGFITAFIDTVFDRTDLEQTEVMKPYFKIALTISSNL